MKKRIRALLDQKAKATASARAIDAAATAQGRDLSDEEQTQFDQHASEIERLNKEIQRETLLGAEEQSQATVAGVLNAVPGEPANAAGRITVTDNREADRKRGFKSMGEFMQSVFRASTAKVHGVEVDSRLHLGAATPTAYSNESAGSDGGFLIPPEFSETIFKLSLGEGSLLPMTDDCEIDSNAMTFPKDETTPWGGNGVRAYWQGEAAAANATKPVIGIETLRLKKLMALVPVTDELLADGNALASYLPSKIGDSIRLKANEAILFGAGGNGLPLGAFGGPNAPAGAVVTIAKEVGQAAGTLNAMNLGKMIARLPPGSFANAVWIINNDVLPALFTLTLGNFPIYMPVVGQVGGVQLSPYGMLLGRPIIVSQHANSFSSQGDVLLADLNHYQSITKADGLQTATSMHLYFDSDATAFRTTFRMDGQPKLSAPILPAKGANPLSPFVQLGAR
jgi:HK97 family phage major capsid protein